jgi:hypothetical protein
MEKEEDANQCLTEGRQIILWRGRRIQTNAIRGGDLQMDTNINNIMEREEDTNQCHTGEQSPDGYQY